MLPNIYKEIYRLESSRNLVIKGFKDSFITCSRGKYNNTFTYHISDICLASNIIRVRNLVDNILYYLMAANCERQPKEGLSKIIKVIYLEVDLIIKEMIAWDAMTADSPSKYIRFWPYSQGRRRYLCILSSLSSAILYLKLVPHITEVPPESRHMYKSVNNYIVVLAKQRIISDGVEIHMCYQLLSINKVIQYLKLDFNRQYRKRHYSITVLEKLLGGKAKYPYIIILIYYSWVALRLK